MSVMHRVVLLFLLSTTSVWSYSRFRDAIPNGHVVPNPCYNVKGGQEEVWAGVGHKDINGGGELNPFGEVSLGFELAWWIEWFCCCSYSSLSSESFLPLFLFF